MKHQYADLAPLERDMYVFVLRDAQGVVRVVWKSGDPWRTTKRWWTLSRDLPESPSPIVAWLATLNEQPEVEVVAEVYDSTAGSRVMALYRRIREEHAHTALPTGIGGRRPGAGRPSWQQVRDRERL